MLTIALRIAFGFTVLAVVLLAIRLRQLHRRLAAINETVGLLEETNQAVDLVNAALHRAGATPGRHLHRIKGIVWVPVGWLLNEARGHPILAKAAAATASGSLMFAGVTELPPPPARQPPPAEAPSARPVLPPDSPPAGANTTTMPSAASAIPKSASPTAAPTPEPANQSADGETVEPVSEPVTTSTTEPANLLPELPPTTVALPSTTLPTIPPTTIEVAGPDCELVELDLLGVEACI